jgi:hypothetical protein
MNLSNETIIISPNNFRFIFSYFIWIMIFFIPAYFFYLVNN